MRRPTPTRTRLAGLAATALLAAAGAGCSHSPSASSPTTGAAPDTTSTTTAPTTTAATTLPRAPTTTSTTTAGRALPVSVETDAEMKADGNEGPSSSILLPRSCEASGDEVTAAGGYTNGGFAPNVYNRYGDIVRLYVYGAPQSGYPQGIQLGQLAAATAPAIGGHGSWKVTDRIDPTLGTPADCVVAAQPTQTFQGAP